LLEQHVEAIARGTSSPSRGADERRRPAAVDEVADDARLRRLAEGNRRDARAVEAEQRAVDNEVRVPDELAASPVRERRVVLPFRPQAASLTELFASDQVRDQVL